MRQRYGALILAYGAGIPVSLLAITHCHAWWLIHDMMDVCPCIIIAGERDLSIPGNNLAGIHSARSFVNWYNAHPSHANVCIHHTHTITVLLSWHGTDNRQNLIYRVNQPLWLVKATLPLILHAFYAHLLMYYVAPIWHNTQSMYDDLILGHMLHHHIIVVLSVTANGCVCLAVLHGSMMAYICTFLLCYVSQLLLGCHVISKQLLGGSNIKKVSVVGRRGPVQVLSCCHIYDL